MNKNAAQLSLLNGIKDYLVLASKHSDNAVLKEEAAAMLKRVDENQPLAAFEKAPGAPATTY